MINDKKEFFITLFVEMTALVVLIEVANILSTL